MKVTRAWSRRAAALAVLCACNAPASAFEGYVVTIEGAPNGLHGALESASALARNGRRFPTTAALAIMARRDAESLAKALTAAGYYASSADFEVSADQPEAPAHVTFAITPGPLFKISAYQIEYADDVGVDRPNSPEAAGIDVSGGADGASLQRTQQAFLSALWDNGFPAARITARRADAKFETGEAVAVFTFESGPRAAFGDIRINGADATAPVYLEKLKTWTKGEPFDRSKLVAYQDRLRKTGLFAGIEIEPGAPAENGAAPVLVTLKERKRRTIGAGASYSTAEGPGARLFFEYRNLFHRGEKARIEVEGSEIEQSITFNFNKPLPNFPGSTFAQMSFENETTDAFDARTVILSGGLSRKWLKDRLETRGALALETSKVRTEASEERTYFVSLPLSAVWNTEDNLLDPTRGVRTSLTLTPYTGSDSFTIADFAARTRFNFGSKDRFTAAVRGRLGATFGSTLADLPSNKHFYAGGGASVRGYDFQAAGPLDADGHPIGGRSIIEGAFEARARVAEKFQIAAFIDAGSVSAQSLPDFSGDYFLGVGAGLRYLTAVGPIRVDLATPLERRDSDRAVQLYISLGQSF